MQNHPELVDILAAWPTLPEPVRTGILAVVRASGDAAQGAE